jgi:hypothetical protein
MNDRRAWLTLLAALLCGCVQISWERAAYEGVRQGAKNAASQPGAKAVPDPKLPSHEAYRKVRRAE